MKMSRLTILMSASLLILTSCSEDLFDKKTYNKAVNYQFMVDNVDPEHDWCLTKNDTMSIRVKDSQIYSVQILTEDPYTSENAEIAAESVCFGGWENLTFTISDLQSQVYVAALDKNGDYLGVKPTAYNIKKLELSTADLQSTGTLTEPTYQTFTYLYDTNFPQPGQFDYNDMVLRINKNNPDIGNTLVVDLNVTLEACGANQLYAAGIHLGGINYDDITKVEIVDGKPLDDGYPLQRIFITSDVLTKARNGEAVISLFECAQWAMAKKKNKLGDISVIKYNVSLTDEEEKTATVAPVTATYRITFKDRDKARSMTFDRIDPFVIHQNSNGGIWEVHTYAYKFDETLRELYYGQESAYDNHISWALVIPKHDFRYPLEGLPIASYNEETGEVFGSYLGFIDWMMDHENYHDWYLKLDHPYFVY